MLVQDRENRGPEDCLSAYCVVEGYGPFDRESGLAALTAVVLEEPRPMLRAGALEPLLSAMLTKDPVHRITAEGTAAALSAILTPQPHPRTRLDQGSEPPWAGAATDTAAPRTPSAPRAPQGYGPPPAQAVRRRRRGRVLPAVLGAALGLALAGAGTWYAIGEPHTGDAKPYGDAVGLAEPLADGDCVAADWRGAAPFTGRPRLEVVRECRSGGTEGQVMAVFEAPSGGAGRCERRTERTRKSLAAVRSYAVLPADDGFDAAGRRVACLLLDSTGHALFGPLGNHRAPGTTFTDTATMQKHDCLDVISDNSGKLVSCKGPHRQKVLDFLQLGQDIGLREAREQATAACRANMPPNDYGHDPNTYETSSWVGRSAWNSGTHFVVCTAIRQDGGTMGGDEA
jgi:hypothetical protein